MSEAEVKGQRFNRIVEVIRDMAAPDAYQRMLATVSTDARSLMTRAPAATIWLPARHLDNVLRTALSVVYDHDLQRVFDQGRQSFIRDVRSVYRLFIKFMSPEHVIRRAGIIFGTYYRNNGGLRILEQTRNDLIARYDDVQIGSPAFWEQSRGAISGSLEATGQHDIRAQVIEGGGEAKFCVMRVFWA